MSSNADKYADYRMIPISAGVVDLRDDRIKQTWTTSVDAFLLAPVPVTQSLYDAITQSITDSKVKPEAPVTDVSWLDAILFCNLFSRYSGLQSCYSIIEAAGDTRVEWDRGANGFRLPTEAEWQYACKAGTSGYRYGELDAIAWYRENSNGQLHEVGQNAERLAALLDMLGNVWEWCWDLYDTEVYGDYRVFRGGSWAEEARDVEQHAAGAVIRRFISTILVFVSPGGRVRLLNLFTQRIIRPRNSSIDAIFSYFGPLRP